MRTATTKLKIISNSPQSGCFAFGSPPLVGAERTNIQNNKHLIVLHCCCCCFCSCMAVADADDTSNGNNSNCNNNSSHAVICISVSQMSKQQSWRGEEDQEEEEEEREEVVEIVNGGGPKVCCLPTVTKISCDIYFYTTFFISAISLLHHHMSFDRAR